MPKRNTYRQLGVRERHKQGLANACWVSLESDSAIGLRLVDHRNLEHVKRLTLRADSAKQADALRVG